MQQSLIFIQSGILPENGSKVTKWQNLSNELHENKFYQVSWGNALFAIQFSGLMAKIDANDVV